MYKASVKSGGVMGCSMRAQDLSFLSLLDWNKHDALKKIFDTVISM